ncbi:MAG: efflux RND transporter periplasmic adaptor subunit [Anaerolineales bacterium]|nr:efflux RND transporter periplasmic adaptor subunit [Anaerolineales bacterium]
MKRIIPIIILIAVVGGAYWWYNQPRVDAAPAAGLVGSGTIEAETIAITTEIGGRIIAIKAGEGDEVDGGQVLVEIDPSSLLAQQAQLEATLETTEANLAMVSAPPRLEDIAAAAARLAQAKVARDGAKITWEAAQMLVNNPHQLTAQINQAQARVTQAQTNLEQAQIVLKRAEIQAEAASRNQSTHTALVQNEVAQQQLRSAQVGLQMAEVGLAGAKQQVQLLQGLRDNPLQLISQANTAKAAYRQAEAAIVVAEANLAAAKANPTVEDIAVAQAQVAEAQAALAKVQVQLDKLTLTAPRAGLISHQLVQPGELAAPGAVLLELSDIDTVDLTIYIPETQIGRVKVGQPAQVYVDAYPAEVFGGSVTFINHEAEFTPRNVQTQEERVNLVFGVKITLDNPDHRLKPGMPADAELREWEKGGMEDWRNGKVVKGQPTLQPSPTPAIQSSPTPVSQPSNLPTLQPSNLPTSQPSNPPTLQPSNPQAEIITWGLNVRTGPGMNYPVVAHLAQGTVVPVLETDTASGWLKVQLPNGEQTGWITNNPAYVAIR